MSYSGTERHVLVIADSEHDISNIINQYSKKNHVQFCSKRNEAMELYKNTVDKFELNNGKLVNPYDINLYIEISESEYRKTEKIMRKKISGNNKPIYLKYAPELVGAKLRTIPFSELYKTIDLFIEQYLKIPYDIKEKDFGEWSNPNGKWSKYTKLEILRDKDNPKELVSVIKKGNCIYTGFVPDAYVSKDGWVQTKNYNDKFKEDWLTNYQKMFNNISSDKYLCIINIIP